MPRDYRKLKVFQKADDLVAAVYRATSKFPKNEMFGLTSQLRRAIVSVPANIAEGSARHTEAEFLNFLNIAYGSLTEASYYIDLSRRLGYLSNEGHETLQRQYEETSRMLNGLMKSVRSKS
jgi:four helix bundle protein